MKEKIIEFANKLRAVDYKLVGSSYAGYIGKEIYEVTLANGAVKRVERIIKNKQDGDAVVIIPVTKEGKFVIIVQSRPNMIDTDGVAIEFPAGMVDPGEEFVDSARRELLEETGYTCSSLEEIEFHYQDQGCSNAVIKTFVANDCEKRENQKLDPDEMLQVLEVTLDELVELLDNGSINDASTKLGILTYLRQNKKD
ncbi:MAG: NUDIX hydrolase [Bacilli bacterium]|nr:NUDIX hydrolase [Bacilli bacterium]